MFFRRLNWNVIAWFSTVSTISTAVILAGVVAMVLTFRHTGHPLRLGLSFTGGTDVTVKFARPVTADAIRSALQGIGGQEIAVDSVAKTSDAVAGERYTISTQTAFGNDTATFWKTLGKLAPVDRAQSEISSVGPSLSHEYLIKALEALVIAIAIQFLYIAFRFGWNYIFGLVTVIALVRDALMMIGIYAIAGKRADDAFLAAVLTVVGYSVMDTIVILDRIRENTRVMAGETYDRIVNIVDLADDDAFDQYAGDGRHHARRLAGVRRRLIAELRLRALGRDLFGRLSLDLFLRAARPCAHRTAARQTRRKAGAESGDGWRLRPCGA